MPEEYYVDMGGETAGPFPLERIERLYFARVLTKDTLYALPNSVQWLPLSTLIPLFQPLPLAMTQPVESVQYQERPSKPIAFPNDMICGSCMTIGQTRREGVKGSFLVELALWLLFCAPGLIYSLWRHTARRQCCAVCGGFTLIPANSPRGRQIAEVYIPVSGPSWSYRFGGWCGRQVAKLTNRRKTDIEV